MSDNYSPRDYWEQRLSGSFNLRGVGHRNFSEGYNRSLYHRKTQCLERAMAGVPVEGKQVLDVGCGTGFFVDWYLRHGATVRGIDITEVSISQLRERFAGSDFRTLDIGAPDYSVDRQFDIVNMWDVIYHIVVPDAFDRALANIAKSLRPGGLFLLTDWFGAPADTRVAAHVHARCLSTHSAKLGALGFELVRMHPLYHLLNKRHLGSLDNQLAPFYCWLDDRATTISRDNLSLGVWRKQ